MLYRIPLFMVISDRGHFGERDPWQTEGGRYTRRILDALNVQHDVLRTPGEVAPKIGRAMTLAHSSLSPVAVLLTRDLMWEEPAPA
jgi:sulfopyruvate decarboxylase subunit alpha